MSLTEREIVTILDDTVPNLFSHAGQRGLDMQTTAEASRKEGDAEVNLVTTADIELQRIILEGLLKTRLASGRILAEESTPDLTDRFGGDPKLTISIDPINGTERYRAGSRSWEILITITTSNSILYSCSYSPGLGFTVVVDNFNGVRREGELPFVANEQRKIMARWAQDLAKDPQLAPYLSSGEYELVEKDEPVPEMGGRVGRNISLVSGRLKGVLMGHPNTSDGLFLAHYARHLPGAKVVTFGRDGGFDGETDLVTLGSFKGGTNNIYSPGGYLVINP